MQKQYQLKIYELDGTYKKTINPEQIKSEISFSSPINGSQGQCLIDLNLPFDDFGEGVNIKHVNVCKVYEADDTNHATPVLIYTGFISQYVPHFHDAEEGVKLVLLGIGALLNFAYYKSGNNYTVNHSTTDPATIVKAVIDHFNTIYPGGWIDYNTSSVANTGTNVSYEFVDQKWFDVIKKALELAGGNWWWKIAEDGKLYFKSKPTEATHTFTIGKDVSSADITKNNEGITNLYQLRYSSPQTTKNYTDAASILLYGTREMVEQDSRITILATADQKGNGKIADYKNAKVEAKIRINSGYDLESIHPGDTCTILNSKKGSSVFPENMLITSVKYYPDYVDLDLENNKTSFANNFNEAVVSITQ